MEHGTWEWKADLSTGQAIHNLAFPGGNIFTSSTSATASGLTDSSEASHGHTETGERRKRRGERKKKVAGITREMSYMSGEGSITGLGRRRKRKVDSMRRILTGSWQLLLKSNRLSVFCLREAWNTWKGKCRMRFTEERDMGKGQGLQAQVQEAKDELLPK